MSTRTLILASFSAILASSAAVSYAASPDSCVLSRYDASSVAPYRAEENVGYGTYSTLKGAQVFVPAREGLTEQWLLREVQTALATSCKIPARDVKVQVTSAGTGFWVQLIAANEEQGKALLSWAHRILQR